MSKKYRKWTASDIELVRKLWGLYSLKDIAKYFEVRPQNMSQIARNHGIQSGDSRKTITKSIDIDISTYVDTMLEINSCFPEDSVVNPEPARPRYTATLCWYCAKACGGYDCEWAANLTPVEGWNAAYNPIRCLCEGKLRMIDSYHVIDCPKFIPDP